MIRSFLLLPAFLLLTLALRAQDQSIFWPSAVKAFDTTVNSPGVELMPLLSADGTTLYFDRKYSAGNLGGEDDPDDMYIMKRDAAGRWFAPANAGPSLNTSESDLLLWLSRDGSQALVATERLRPLTHHGLGIIRRTETGWTPPLPITIDGVRTYGDFVYATISPDERHMIIAYPSDTANPDSYDLYLCNALGDDLRHWSAPVNLGSGVNTGRFDGAPNFAWDNRTLYFASNGHDGVGETDIYMIRRIGETWNDWSRPVNLGSTVNSPLDDYSMTISLDGMAVLATHLGTEETDLYVARLPDSLRPLRVVAVEGKVHNGGHGLRGLIRAETKGAAEVTTVSGEDGRFKLFLPPGATWRIMAMIPGGGGGTKEVVLPAIPPTAPVSVDLPVTASHNASDSMTVPVRNR